MSPCPGISPLRATAGCSLISNINQQSVTREPNETENRASMCYLRRRRTELRLYRFHRPRDVTRVSA
jgi:hypothetical protein